MEELELFLGTKVTTIEDAPKGLLYLIDSNLLIFKSEYGDNDGKMDIFIVSSGEFFHGNYEEKCRSLQIL